jgi:hypothetical protein
MNTKATGLLSGEEHFTWELFAVKYRKFLIPILTALIVLGALSALRIYLSLENKLKKLSVHEPIYVIAVNKDLDAGHALSPEDLRPMLFYKSEFNKLFDKDIRSGLSKPKLISCTIDASGASIQNSSEDLIGRVLNIPVYRDSVLRMEYLAPRGVAPGILSLLDVNHSLLDLQVPQTGFNIFIKPNDYVDLFELTEHGSQLLAGKVKVILVDSLPSGKAPYQVNADAQAKRNLTLALPNSILARALKAQQKKSLLITYGKSYLPKTIQDSTTGSENGKFFQRLILIRGKHKEILGG